MKIKTKDILYDLLEEKINGQIFYNNMMINMVNPVARHLFLTFRDREERDVVNIRKQFLFLESKPMVYRAFLRG